jgi:CRISPR/Cas system-associated protein Cas10 (large subunit of type III CRISPR-Cas system)
MIKEILESVRRVNEEKVKFRDAEEAFMVAYEDLQKFVLKLLKDDGVKNPSRDVLSDYVHKAMDIKLQAFNYLDKHSKEATEVVLKQMK